MLQVAQSEKPKLSASKMALATIETPETEKNDPTSVHPKETSEHCAETESYRARLLKLEGTEYEAAKIGYEQLDALDGKDRVGNMGECRTGAWFAVHLQTGTVRVLSSSCRQRWCPLCVRAKVGVIVKNLVPWLKARPGPKFLTLTLKHSQESLDAQVTRLYGCFRELRRRKYWKSSVRSGVWFFQIKWSDKTDSWHPHLHCVLDAEYMPHKLLKQMWHEVTGDSTIVDIKAVRDPQKVAEYVARYAARPCNLADLNNWCKLQVMTALHGRRLCGKWGDCKDLQLSVKPADTKEEYVVVCHYSRLSDLCKISDFAKTIRTAFRDGSVLPLYTSKEAVTQAVQDMWDETRPEPPPIIPDPQLLLWDDNTPWQNVHNPYYFGI